MELEPKFFKQIFEISEATEVFMSVPETRKSAYGLPKMRWCCFGTQLSRAPLSGSF